MNSFFLSTLVFSFFLFSSPGFSAEPQVPPYEVHIGMETNNKMPAWLFEFVAPAGFHFNLQSPRAVKVGSENLIAVGAEASRLGYRSSSTNLKEGMKGEASFYLCNEAKTLCISRKQEFELKVNSELHSLNFQKGSELKSAPQSKKKAKKDEQGFWVNNLEAALQESAQSKKPIFIEFYAIWCPPCNQYLETVFHSSAFKRATDKWVLLKLDADDAVSFQAKSQFKVGGYPSIVFTKPANRELGLKSLEEIDRIIGFFPLPEFLKRFRQIDSQKQESMMERLSSQKNAYLENLKRAFEIDIEKRNFDQAEGLAKEANAIAPNDLEVQLNTLIIQAKRDAKILGSKEARSFFAKAQEQIEKQSSSFLFNLLTLLTSESSVEKADLEKAKSLFPELQKRMNPKTLSLDGCEFSIADLEAAKIDFYESLKDEAAVKAAYQSTITALERLIALEPKVDSRGLNLDLAYYLWKSGAVERARKIFDHFISKYPEEFTFYFAASKMDLELKNLEKARAEIEKALQYSYGDNQIRVMERMVRVMNAQGQGAFALDRGKQFLESLKIDPSLAVRSQRYVDALKKALQETETGKK